MHLETATTYSLPHVVRHYDQDSAPFWQHFSQVGKLFLRRFVDLVPYREGVSGQKERVADLGAASGHGAHRLKERGLETHCIDISPGMVEVCKGKGFSAEVGDFMATGQPDNAFGGVLAAKALHQVPKADFPAALSEVRRILRKGAPLALIMVKGVGESITHKYGSPSHVSYYKEGELGEYLDQAGFQLEEDIQSFPWAKSTYLHCIAIRKD